ncbi:MAG: hypothetical protein AAB421_04570 [Patescibacteria group bacterium]
MANRDNLHEKTQQLKDQLIELHKKSGLPGEPIDFARYQPAINLCDTVIEYIPEFKEYKDYVLWGKENPYLHFGVFGDFFVNKIAQASDSDPVVKKAFDFVNDTYNKSNDEQIRTMLGTEVFEKMTLSKQTSDTAKKYLEGDAFDQFSKALS